MGVEALGGSLECITWVGRWGAFLGALTGQRAASACWQSKLWLYGVIWPHPAFPLNLLYSCPAGLPASSLYSHPSVLDSDSSLSLACPHSLTPLGLSVSNLASKPRLDPTSFRKPPLDISQVREWIREWKLYSHPEQGPSYPFTAHWLCGLGHKFPNLSEV